MSKLIDSNPPNSFLLAAALASAPPLDASQGNMDISAVDEKFSALLAGTLSRGSGARFFLWRLGRSQLSKTDLQSTLPAGFDGGIRAIVRVTLTGLQSQFEISASGGQRTSG